MKKENGITLVALVVTIIVLLILAGVTISLALNNQGLINRAKGAENAHQRGAQNEVNAMTQGEKEINDVINTYVNH